MACRLGLEYCSRSCGCANCPENISASPTFVDTTPEQEKYLAEIGMCNGKNEDETFCLNCQYITCCTSNLGVLARLKNNIAPSEDYGKTLSEFEEDAFGGLFEP
jgi:hypothetical protein